MQAGIASCASGYWASWFLLAYDALKHFFSTDDSTSGFGRPGKHGEYGSYFCVSLF